MSVVLGINAFHAGASAALAIDGEIVHAIAEERLNRTKYYAGFPKLAIQAALDSAGLTLRDIEHVAVGRDSSANRRKKLAYVLKHPLMLSNLLKIKGARDDLNDMRVLFSREFGVEPGDLKFEQHAIEHHLAHTASAFFTSGWEEAAAITIDGSGDFVTCMMSECSGREIQPVHRIYVPNSLGSFYTMVCQFIGYARYGDEGKVMGLAPLGRDTYRDSFVEMVNFEDGQIRLNPDYFLPFGRSQGMTIDDNGQVVLARHYSDRMVEAFGPPRQPGSEITQRDMDLARGLQHRFEDVYFALLNHLHQRVPSDRVVMAGGCTLNSVANGKIFDRTPFKETTIHPAAGDDGLAVGAALYVSQVTQGLGVNRAWSSAYLGGQWSDEDIRSALDRAGLSYEKLDRDELVARTADEIASGQVVGWFQGRSEWGPRALGNRSILCHPGFPGMKDALNARIKRRESFRPFAPAVLADQIDSVFTHDHPSPFMMHVYQIREEWRDRLTAVNHVDDTGRLQSVTREQNPLYYDLISAFRDRTGIPVLLNTSFNENEPIVEDHQQAIDCFVRTQMDVLVAGSFLCKKAQPGS